MDKVDLNDFHFVIIDKLEAPETSVKVIEKLKVD